MPRALLRTAMSTQGPPNVSFEVTHPTKPAEALIAGFSTFGLAGLTAVDYLVNHLEMDPSGYVSSADLPAITPFEQGRPRHHTRLFSRDGLDVSVLVNELFVPVWGAESFAKAVLEWSDATGVREVAVLAGVPVPHGPEEHTVFYVATDDFREHRLTERDIPPMANGFLDGINAALLERGMTSELKVGVFITPVHARAPDVEAAIRLLETVEPLYDVPVDVADLRAFAAEVDQYYRELAERLESAEPAARPEDRMYM